MNGEQIKNQAKGRAGQTKGRRRHGETLTRTRA
jgi:hypothetical protein